MKKLFTLIMLSSFITVPAMAQSLKGISPGEIVIESYGDWSIQTVVDIIGKRFLLSDGATYSPDEVHKQQEKLNNISVGENVMKTYPAKSIKAVKAIGNNRFLLFDGNWYLPHEVHKLQEKLNNISVVDNVNAIDSYDPKSIHTVEAIARYSYFLSDGYWYYPHQVRKVQNSSSEDSQHNCEAGAENGNCDKSVNTQSRSQTRMMEKSDQINASPTRATGSSTANI